MFKSLGVLAAIVIIIAAVVLAPLVVIWAWNTLFGAAYLIPYAFETWLAVLVVGGFLRSNIKITKK